jgi:lipoprotein-releasing system permease protein
VKAVSLRGVDADAYDHIISVREKLQSGVWRLAGGEVVVGSELAKDLGLSVGDKLRLTTVGDKGDNHGDVFTVAGVFDLGNKT